MASRPSDIKILRKVALVLVLLSASHLITSLHQEKKYWLNITGSEPRGLYMLEKGAGVKRGDLVLMDLPPAFHTYVYGRHWLPEEWPLVKHVGAVAGDRLCVADGLFQINGVPMGPVYRVDSAGLPLPRLEGCQEVPAGHFLPVAQRIQRSFDGRYMGPVPFEKIRGKMRPVWTEQFNR